MFKKYASAEAPERTYRTLKKKTPRDRLWPLSDGAKEGQGEEGSVGSSTSLDPGTPAEPHHLPRISNLEAAGEGAERVVPGASGEDEEFTVGDRKIGLREKRALWEATLPPVGEPIAEPAESNEDLGYTYVEADHTPTITYQQREMERLEQERLRKASKGKGKGVPFTR